MVFRSIEFVLGVTTVFTLRTRKRVANLKRNHLCHLPQLTTYATSFLSFIVADLPKGALSVDLLLRAPCILYKQ